MKQIPDAPWIRDPERYQEMYYGKPVMMPDGEEDEDEEDQMET